MEIEKTDTEAGFPLQMPCPATYGRSCSSNE